MSSVNVVTTNFPPNQEVRFRSLLHEWRRLYVLNRLQSNPITQKLCKIKWSHYRPGVAQRDGGRGRGIALLFHDRGTRRGWVVSSTPRPHSFPGKDPVPILQETGWAPWPVWTGGNSRPNRDSISDHPARSQSLYQLSYRAHLRLCAVTQNSLLSGIL